MKKEKTLVSSRKRKEMGERERITTVHFTSKNCSFFSHFISVNCLSIILNKTLWLYTTCYRKECGNYLQFTCTHIYVCFQHAALWNVLIFSPEVAVIGVGIAVEKGTPWRRWRAKERKRERRWHLWLCDPHGTVSLIPNCTRAVLVLRFCAHI